MAREVMTLRADRLLRARLRAVARRRGLSPSATARMALSEWLEAEESGAAARPYDLVGDLLGSVRGAEPKQRRRAARRRR